MQASDCIFVLKLKHGRLTCSDITIGNSHIFTILYDIVSIYVGKNFMVSVVGKRTIKCLLKSYMCVKPHHYLTNHTSIYNVAVHNGMI